MNFSGYKTVITGAMSVLSGLALAFGVDLDADTIKLLSDNINLVIGGGMSGYGAIMLILRAFTNSPMFKKAE